jgi:hypothetical protein
MFDDDDDDDNRETPGGKDWITTKMKMPRYTCSRKADKMLLERERKKNQERGPRYKTKTEAEKIINGLIDCVGFVFDMCFVLYYDFGGVSCWLFLLP